MDDRRRRRNHERVGPGLQNPDVVGESLDRLSEGAWRARASRHDPIEVRCKLRRSTRECELPKLAGLAFGEGKLKRRFDPELSALV